ncbi:MAG: ATP-binding protein [Chromatiaceae bacterium]
MIPRDAESILREHAKGYPVVALTGPRQSGKTTLARAVFAEKPYVSLENPAMREFADTDPQGFFRQYADGAVIDEAQRCPALFQSMQGVVDEARKPGQFIVTGSQQFGLLTGISQSLAGRVAMHHLLPFSAAELRRVDLLPDNVEAALFKGAYPPVYDRRLDPSGWYANYVQTYLERDVRQLINVRDLTQFQRFLRLCAGRSGQLLNLSALGEETGVSHNTVREWLSVLEASFIIHRLPPYYRNFNKRLVKTPKLYFYDTGLVTWLLGIEEARQIRTHPLRGALFETWVVGEFMKKRLNTGRPPNLSFWRDRAGHEVDLLLPESPGVRPVEIKSGATLQRDAWRNLAQWRDMAGAEAGRPILVYGGDESQRRSDVDVLPWREV